jgi:putative restriction endonuclease
VLFRVKGRRGRIAGYGSFFNSAIYWAHDAWDIFRERNGAGTHDDFIERIEAQRTVRNPKLYAIACHDIVQPTYFGELKAQLPEAALRRLGNGPIDEESPDGKLLLSFVQDAEFPPPRAEIDEEFGSSGLSTKRSIRPGRSGFRMAVIEAYGRTCAVTGETVLPCLDAAHLLADQLGGPMHVGNALLLRRDVHPLLEAGYLAVSNDYRVMISAWLPKAYEQSRTYLDFNNKPLRLPKDRNLWPDPRWIERHRAMTFFKGGRIGP